jgi:hypothetical protein
MASTRGEHFSGRADKNSVILGRKNPAHDHSTGLGRAARTLFSVKQLKTTFWVALGPKIFLRASRSLPMPAQ